VSVAGPLGGGTALSGRLLPPAECVADVIIAETSREGATAGAVTLPTKVMPAAAEGHGPMPLVGSGGGGWAVCCGRDDEACGGGDAGSNGGTGVCDPFTAPLIGRVAGGGMADAAGVEGVAGGVSATDGACSTGAAVAACSSTAPPLASSRRRTDAPATPLRLPPAPASRANASRSPSRRSLREGSACIPGGGSASAPRPSRCSMASLAFCGAIGRVC